MKPIYVTGLPIILQFLNRLLKILSIYLKPALLSNRSPFLKKLVYQLWFWLMVGSLNFNKKVPKLNGLINLTYLCLITTFKLKIFQYSSVILLIIRLNLKLNKWNLSICLKLALFGLSWENPEEIFRIFHFYKFYLIFCFEFDLKLRINLLPSLTISPGSN